MGYNNRPKSEINMFDSLPDHLAITDAQVWTGDEDSIEGIHEDVMAYWECYPEPE
jgi:hypothetical protein